MDRRQFFTASLAVASLKLAGLAGAEAAPSPARSRAHVYLLRGLMGVSQGMDVLAAKLRQRGIRATVHAHGDASSLAAQAAAAYKNGTERPIILIGHSLGGSAILAMASELGRDRIPVALVVPIDPYGSTEVPSNVRRVVNFYISDGMGSAVSKSAKSRSQITNIDFKGDPDGGHMAIQRSDRVHRRIISYVLAAI
jgi:alpha-beta hydrolase superfamily lysophospholipase